MAGVGHVAREVTFKVGSTDYKCEVTGIDFAQNTPMQSSTVLCDDGVVRDAGITEYTLNVSYNVDHGTSSFFTFLFTNAGTTSTFEYTSSDGKAKYTGSVLVLGGNANAQAGSFESGQVELPVIGGVNRTTVA